MSRYSPTVRQDEAPDIAGQIAQAFMSHRALKREKVLEQREDEEYTEAKSDREYIRSQRGTQEAVAEADRYDAGFRRGDQVDRTTGEEVRTNASGATLNVPGVRDLGGKVQARPEDRYERFGELYRDPNATPAGRKAAANRAAYENLPPEARVGEYVPEVDYLSQIGEEFEYHRGIRTNDHETGNELKVEGVQQTGRVQLAGIDNDAAMARTRVQEAGANGRHDRPTGTSLANTGGGGASTIRGPGRLTQDQAYQRAIDIISRRTPDGEYKYERDEAGVIELAEQLYAGTYAAPSAPDAEPAEAPKAPGRVQQMVRGIGGFIDGLGEGQRTSTDWEAVSRGFGGVPGNLNAAPRQRTQPAPTPEQRKWDAAAADARALGIDPEEVIGHARPR